MKPYVVLNKKVGETPLACLQAYQKKHAELADVPMAYAGRLDPMAEGSLLILIGDECKRQERYHHLDKEYVFEVLLGVGSDTADVLGLLKDCPPPEHAARKDIQAALKDLHGDIELPYPHFSSKTVQGKPLHVWTLEGKIGEITIPTKKSAIHVLRLQSLRVASAAEIYAYVRDKIETIPPVTEASKALGNDFRREDVRKSWNDFLEKNGQDRQYQIATIVCVASSGTYMRTLAEVIASALHTCGLAYSIKRTRMGTYRKILPGAGFWSRQF